MSNTAAPRVNRMQLADGRTLAWAEYGDPRGVPVFYFHGGGASLIEGGCFDRDARDAGIRLVAPSRPGGLHSSPRPVMRSTDFASDCAQLATRLGIDKFVVTGNSNGGLFTMAVAHQLPDRVIAAVPINSTVPLYDPDVWPLVPWSLKAAMLFFRTFPSVFVPMNRFAVKSRPDRFLPKAAEAEIAQIYFDNLMAITQDSMRPEIGFMNRRWDFDHRAIRCPVRILYGVEDLGTCYGPRWASELPDGQFMAIPDGHLPIAPEPRRILAATWRSFFA
ncbi:alpha/beta fold hydrolase [Solimonas sp. SE-A11]|uniref:alpha/beta fold hydrolase n=1 Tax=Solimonas sp. SE-A11 TaxID=3054954 RepID=UPI00259D0E9E|nr:alpha/beta hydrolase [Solimonas sp. SE-A11]